MIMIAQILLEVLRIGLILLLSCTSEPQSSLTSSKKPHRFDCGSANSRLAAGAIRLTEADGYDSEKDFGWTSKPDESFVRNELERSRDYFSIDGILGDRLDFRIDLPAGKWWVTLWLEAGTEDSSTVSLLFGGRKANPKWHPFRPPAEPRTHLQAAFRVYHGPVHVGMDGLQFSIRGGADEVRLLGFSLTPDPVVETAQQRALFARLHEVGRFAATGSLDGILVELEEIRNSNPEDAFAAYWQEQVQLLREAEEHFEKRGWEKFREQSGLSIFDRFHHAVMILDGLLNHPEAETTPLYERALFLRGRLLYWLGEERHGPNEMAGGHRDLVALYKKYTDDELLAMYNGEQVDLPDPCDDLGMTSGAPEWSRKQRELLCRMRQIAHWWVTEQQAENGEFGGKLGDDVELLRWWTPLILAGDTVALEGWRKLADGVLENRKVYKGYSRFPIDVEHSSEFIADTAPAMVLYSDDPVYVERLRFSADYFTNLWTGKTERGNRFFRSAWFSSTTVDERPPRNRDLEYNCRAVKAVRYLAWKTADRQVIDALREWSQAWVSAAMRTDKGKPKGIIPASVRFPDEAINGDEPTWYRANMFWDYFDWRAHAGCMMLDQLLFTYTLTGDESLLRPVYAALNLVRAHEATSNGLTAPGSATWAAGVLRRKDGFWSVAAQWRLLTGDTRYDDLLVKYGTRYLRYRLTGEQKHLVDGLERTLREVRFNTPLKTYEALHTDRVYVPGYEHLKAMLTGDGIPESLSPYYAVTWEDTDENFTALVTEASHDRLAVENFSHSSIARNIKMRLWQLQPGNYEVTIGADDMAKTKTTVELKTKGQRFSLELPPRKLVPVYFQKR